MKRIVLSLALAALLIPLMGTFEPAEAGTRWFAGVDFSVGGIGFSLGFSDFDRHRYGPSYGPSYFYRTSRHLSYRGYSCGSACYLRDNYYYHHRDCPLVLQHFRYSRFDPYRVWAGLPYGGGYYYSGPYRPGYYGHHYKRRYDRHRYETRRYDYRRDYRYDHRRDHDGDSDSDSDRWRRDDRGRHDNRSDRYDRGRDDDRRDRGKASRSRSRHRDD